MKRGTRTRQRQPREARKIFLRNPRVWLSIYLLWYFDSSVSFCTKRWTFVLQIMTATFWRQDGNGAFEVPIESTNVSFISHIHVRFLSSVISFIVLPTLALALALPPVRAKGVKNKDFSQCNILTQSERCLGFLLTTYLFRWQSLFPNHAGPGCSELLSKLKLHLFSYWIYLIHCRSTTILIYRFLCYTLCGSTALKHTRIKKVLVWKGQKSSINLPDSEYYIITRHKQTCVRFTTC